MSNIYINITGSDANAGTYISPKATLTGAIAAASSNDTVYVINGLGSSFSWGHTLIDKNITIRAYEPTILGKPIFDGSNGQAGLNINGNYEVSFYDLTFKNAVNVTNLPVVGDAIYSHNTTMSFYRCNFHNLYCNGPVAGGVPSAIFGFSVDSINTSTFESCNFSKLGALDGTCYFLYQHRGAYYTTFKNCSFYMNETAYKFPFIFYTQNYYTLDNLRVYNCIFHNAGTSTAMAQTNPYAPNTNYGNGNNIVGLTSIPTGWTNTLTYTPKFIDPENGVLDLRCDDPLNTAGIIV